MKEYRSIPIGLGLIILVLAGTYYLYIQERQHQKDMMDLIKVQCALIQITTSLQGTQSFDLPLNLRKQKGADKARKDSYSALVLGNWAMNVFYDMESDDVGNVQATFTPMFIS